LYIACCELHHQLFLRDRWSIDARSMRDSRVTSSRAGSRAGCIDADVAERRDIDIATMTSEHP